MSAIYGVLNVSDTERAFVSNIGQELVFNFVELQPYYAPGG